MAEDNSNANKEVDNPPKTENDDKKTEDDNTNESKSNNNNDNKTDKNDDIKQDNDIPKANNNNNKNKTKIDIQSIGKTFVKEFYNKMSKNRKELEPLYQDPSCLSFEGQGYQGCKNIMNKLINLPIKSIKHDPKTVDVQPSGCGGLMIFVTGDLRLDEMQNPVKFSESFHIVPKNGSVSDFWIHNDIFRLQV